jgi:mono/diheme cytochrome c family protein
MKHTMRWFLGLSILGLAVAAAPRLHSADQPNSGSYEAEKAKALANPYPNDSGPVSIDVSAYPAELQDTYKNIFLVKCQRCHQASRPLNSQFVEPSGDKSGHAAKIASWKAANPEMFKDKLVWDVEGWTPSQPGVWERYVKKMMSKPGCNISQPEGKKIWQFLTYDSEKRKTGANAAKWAEHRRKLLADFKASHPARYKELFETN